MLKEAGLYDWGRGHAVGGRGYAHREAGVI